MIKNIVRATFVAVAMTAVAGTASAQQVTSVTTEVGTIEAINLDNKATIPSLVVNTASLVAAGQASASKTDSSTHTFDVSTNKTGTKVSAAFTGVGASNLPAGVTLSVKIGTGTAANISTTAADLLTLTKTSLDNAKVYYTLTANVSAGVMAAVTKELTYTMTAGT